MELFGKQQHLYFINHDLADRVKALVRETISGGRTGEAALEIAARAAALEDFFAAAGPLDRWVRGERVFRR